MGSYTIEVEDDGIIVKGAVNVAHLAGIEKLANVQGFDRIDIGLAQALGAIMVLTNAAGSKKMRSAIEIANRSKGPELAWLTGCDTGLSSKTIFYTLTGRGAFERESLPHDADDFGRCYRLLMQFPDWGSRLQEVVTVHPNWDKVVENWHELSCLFEKKSYETLNKRLQEINA